MGNLGSAKTKCLNTRIGSDQILLGCQHGSIKNITDWGVYERDSQADIMDLCISKLSTVGTNLPDCSYLSNS